MSIVVLLAMLILGKLIETQDSVFGTGFAKQAIITEISKSNKDYFIESVTVIENDSSVEIDAKLSPVPPITFCANIEEALKEKTNKQIIFTSTTCTQYDN